MYPQVVKIDYIHEHYSCPSLKDNFQVPYGGQKSA